MSNEILSDVSIDPTLGGTLRRSSETLSVQLTKALGARIARGEIKPGDKLPSEHALIDAYGVSRTVVREAISSLKAKGMIATRHGVGAFVLQATPSVTLRIEHSGLSVLGDIMNVLELRIALEVEAAGLAAQRRTAVQLDVMRALLDQMADSTLQGEDGIAHDRGFHLELLRAAGNPHFSALLEPLGELAIPRASLDLFAQDSVARTIYLQCIGLEHENIYRAIHDQDVKAARSAMRQHLSNSRERLRQSLETQSGSKKGSDNP
ncbi:FadR family transcriptional regulator [Alcaligenaceae bacterium]|nr:FadR family transcriptional regulator [Alcaligenaceae bacterium]